MRSGAGAAGGGRRLSRRRIPTSPSASRAFADQRDALRAALAPIADEPLPAELNLSRIIEQRARRPSPLGGLSRRCCCSASAAPAAGPCAARCWHRRSGWSRSRRRPPTSYSVYAPDRVRPVEVRASDSAELVQWVSNRLHRPVKVPDLAASGYRLDGRTPRRHPARPGGDVHV